MKIHITVRHRTLRSPPGGQDARLLQPRPDSSTRRRLPTPFLLRSSEPELPFRFPAVRNLVRVFLTSFRLPRPSPEMTPEGYRLHGCFARFLLVFRKSSTSAINSWIVADPPAISPAVTTMSVN